MTVIIVAKMGVNVLIDGPDYFVKMLSFNAIVLAISLGGAWHHRADLHT